MEKDTLQFESAKAFRAWLAENHEGEGVWLLFGKKGGPSTLTANEALEEALCYGWIDGVMRSMGPTHYLKYFAPRRKGSPWSDKNKKALLALIEQGRVQAPGLRAMEQAKASGTWDAQKAGRPDESQTESFMGLVKGQEPAYANLCAMPPSVRRTYAGYYYDAKSDAARERRLAKIIERLHQNLRPM